MPQLIDLRPGTRFHVPRLGITGRLLMVNDCRARVRIDQPQQDVEFMSRDGTPRVFRATRNLEASWTPAVSVEVLSYQPLTERDMTTTKKTTPRKKTSTKKPAAAKQTPAKKAKVTRSSRPITKAKKRNSASTGSTCRNFSTSSPPSSPGPPPIWTARLRAETRV